MNQSNAVIAYHMVQYSRTKIPIEYFLYFIEIIRSFDISYKITNYDL